MKTCGTVSSVKSSNQEKNFNTDFLRLITILSFSNAYKMLKWCHCSEDTYIKYVNH